MLVFFKIKIKEKLAIQPKIMLMVKRIPPMLNIAEVATDGPEKNGKWSKRKIKFGMLLNGRSPSLLTHEKLITIRLNIETCFYERQTTGKRCATIKKTQN